MKAARRQGREKRRCQPHQEAMLVLLLLLMQDKEDDHWGLAVTAVVAVFIGTARRLREVDRARVVVVMVYLLSIARSTGLSDRLPICRGMRQHRVPPPQP